MSKNLILTNREDMTARAKAVPKLIAFTTISGVCTFFGIRCLLTWDKTENAKNGFETLFSYLKYPLGIALLVVAAIFLICFIINLIGVIRDDDEIIGFYDDIEAKVAASSSSGRYDKPIVCSRPTEIEDKDDESETNQVPEILSGNVKCRIEGMYHGPIKVVSAGVYEQGINNFEVVLHLQLTDRYINGYTEWDLKSDVNHLLEEVADAISNMGGSASIIVDSFDT